MNEDRILGGTYMETTFFPDNIWERTQDEDLFIKKLTEVDAHETIHMLCVKALREGHEWAVDKMLEDLE